MKHKTGFSIDPDLIDTAESGAREHLSRREKDQSYERSYSLGWPQFGGFDRDRIPERGGRVKPARSAE